MSGLQLRTWLGSPARPSKLPTRGRTLPILERIIGTNKRYADAIDRRVKHTVPWHPILDATEIEPGVWVLSVDSASPIYACVRMVRRGGELGYRVDSRDGELIGYYVRLRSAVFNAWEQTIGNDEKPPPTP